MKTTFQYDHYYDYDEVTSVLKSFEKEYSKYVTLESICVTEENKHLWAITLTNKETGSPLEKPAFYMDGNHHAGEVTGSMACMHFIDVILTNSEETFYKQLLDEKTIYVIPKISPDGSDEYLHTAHKLRSVNRMYPDTLTDGLHTEDINDDGMILMMRVPSPYGAWKKKEDNAFVMTKRLPDDKQGEFYNVYPEGVIENYDGQHITIGKEKWGLDFNRNYPYGWFIEARQPGAGKYPLSNPENKAVADYVIQHPNICSVLTMHTTGGVLVYPPGTMPSSKANQEDMRMYKEIGTMATQEMGYPVVNIFDAFLTDVENYSSGAFDDWCYHTQGIPAYTVELWNVKERSGCPELWPVQRNKTDAQKEDEFLKVVQWIEKNCPEYLIPWKKVHHPQLGEVEVGGIDFKFSCQNCPPKFLLQEMEKTTSFALRYTQALPQIACEDIIATKLSDNIYQIETVVSNTGYLPTYLCQEAKKAQVNQDIKIELTGAQIISKEADIKELSGFFNVQTSYSYDGITTSNYEPCHKKISWVVQAEKGTTLKLTVKSQKAGTLEKTVILS